MSNVPSDAIVPTGGDDFDIRPAGGDEFDIENPTRKNARKLTKQSSAATELLGHEKDLRWWTELGKCTRRAPSLVQGCGCGVPGTLTSRVCVACVPLPTSAEEPEVGTPNGSPGEREAGVCVANSANKTTGNHRVQGGGEGEGGYPGSRGTESERMSMKRGGRGGSSFSDTRGAVHLTTPTHRSSLRSLPSLLPSLPASLGPCSPPSLLLKTYASPPSITSF